MTMPEPTEPGCCFRYEIGGNLVPIDDPLAGGPDDEFDDAGFARIGFGKMTMLGSEHEFSLTIYSSKKREKRWYFAPADFSIGCIIEVVGWPAYLDALRHYAPIFGLSQRREMIDELKKSIQA